MATTTSAPTTELVIHVLADELQAKGHEEAIRQLARRLAQAAGLEDAGVLVDSALLREACEDTYLGRGMALPHARVEGLACAGVCVAHAPAGIAWHGERAQLLVFLAVPEEQPELYLQLMSRLVRWRIALPEEFLSHPQLPAAQWEQELHRLLA